jgi:hypothetical protein
MYFSDEQLNDFENNRAKVIVDLQELQIKIVVAGESLDSSSRVREHLLHGAARRVSVIKRCIENIFLLFPPDTRRPLDQNKLTDVQINLHSFLINLYGLYDNWAWAYVLHHNLEQDIGDRRKIGLFIGETRRRLPPAIRDYLASPIITDWHEKYAKSYRDALAHRIPPYIPPAEMTPEESQRWNELNSQEILLTFSHDWSKLEEIYLERDSLGKPSFSFLHAFTEDTPPRPLLLHGQVLADGIAVSEFGYIFLRHWQETA